MTATRRRAPPLRHFAIVAAKLAVSVALLAWLFSRIDVDRLWLGARRAAPPWLAAAGAVYALGVLVSVWRWRVLLEAQRVVVSPVRLLGSFLVALFFNNFLPSNIGGDVVRIGDTVRLAGSKTLATTVVVADRAIGLMGLVLVAAVGATMEWMTSGRLGSSVWPSTLWAGFLIGAVVLAPALVSPAGVGRLLRPLTIIHPTWVGGRIDNLTATLARFRDRPGALGACFAGAILVQATFVVLYLTMAWALKLDVTPWDLAVIVPLAMAVQMLPVSVNGFGVREATFSLFFARLGLGFESALLLSLGTQALMMAFSLSGAAVYIARRPRPRSSES
jgi:hypothetical protein